jgi:hypothetical protein
MVRQYRGKGPELIIFPVIFPVSREFGAETGSRWTASSAKFYLIEIKDLEAIDRRMGAIFMLRRVAKNFQAFSRVTNLCWRLHAT